MTYVMEGETTRRRNNSGRNDSGRTGKWAKRPVTLYRIIITNYLPNKSLLDYCFQREDFTIQLEFQAQYKSYRSFVGIFPCLSILERNWNEFCSKWISGWYTVNGYRRMQHGNECIITMICYATQLRKFFFHKPKICTMYSSIIILWTICNSV